MNIDNFQSCIQACNACAVACEHCASACLEEDNMEAMRRCIVLDRDCADLCRMAAALMARGSYQATAFCQLCAKACRACGEECARHQHDHCQQCAQACLRCAEECESMAKAA